MKTYTVTETYEAMRRGDILVVDVREANELDANHVPGMTWVPMSEIMDRYEEIPDDREVVLFCRSGNRSARLADMLTAMGDWGDVVNCEGGILAWAEAGLPYEGEQPR